MTAAKEQPFVSLGIKFGPAYDAALATFHGDAAWVGAQLAEASGIPAGDKTFFEQIVEAQSYANGLVSAATIGAKPGRRSTASPEVQGKTTEEVQAPIAQKAAQEQQPEAVTDDLEALIASAANRLALVDIRSAHKPAWTDDHTAMAKARLAELEK